MDYSVDDDDDYVMKLKWINLFSLHGAENDNILIIVILFFHYFGEWTLMLKDLGFE